MKAARTLLIGAIALGAFGCASGPTRYANEQYSTTTHVTSSHRPAHCKDVPLDVPCRRPDVGR